jgi:general stress protein YciG
MWVKIDDGFYRHPKVRAAGKDARALFLASLCWTAANLTDGHIARHDLPVLAAEAEVKGAATARRLVDAGLWDVTADGWQIHDYLDYNPSSEAVRDKRRKRQEAGRKGGLRSGQVRSAVVPGLSATRLDGEATSEANASADAQAESNDQRTPYPYPTGLTPPAPPTSLGTPVDNGPAVRAVS